jgi:hypothetical protein
MTPVRRSAVMETQITAIASRILRLFSILFPFASRGEERLDRKSYDVEDQPILRLDPSFARKIPAGRHMRLLMRSSMT